MTHNDLLKLQVIAKELHGSAFDRATSSVFSWFVQWAALALGAVFALLALWLPFSVVPLLLENPPVKADPESIRALLVGSSTILLAAAALLVGFGLKVRHGRKRSSRTHDLCERILGLKWNVNHRDNYSSVA